MKVENQVCTLEQSQKLKELLNPSKSIFLYWDYTTVDSDFFRKAPILINYGEHCTAAGVGFMDVLKECWYPAFTVAELAVMLPEESTSWRDGTMWACGEMGTDLYMLGKTQADAMAKELIALIETKELTSEECNKRLLA